ncbi:uncharacterized protein METZ01_LOCUS129730 [marine metagenome]|uniref:Uncharacterized protein n=1 Tax=marine metagenome TaxID=408172 RepID=A0A381YIF1_9ZZZZ|tara:strand:+ start:1070 stop:1336 length:267 start_codon:yes stop_codon:yes gene_type:complete
MADPREQTNRLLEMIDDGQLDPMMAVTMCVKWMSEDDVAEMLDANELSERFDEDDEDYDELEDDGQPTWEQEWADFGEVYDDESTLID